MAKLLVIADPPIYDRNIIETKVKNGKQIYRFDHDEPGYTVQEQILIQMRQPNIYPMFCAICKEIPVYYTEAKETDPVCEKYVCKNCFDKLNKENL